MSEQPQLMPVPTPDNEQQLPYVDHLNRIDHETGHHPPNGGNEEATTAWLDGVDPQPPGRA